MTEQALLDFVTHKFVWLPLAMGVARLVMKWFNGPLQARLASAMARAASGADQGAEHDWESVLSTRGYRLLNFALDLLFSVKLPTIADFVKLKNQAGGVVPLGQPQGIKAMKVIGLMGLMGLMAVLPVKAQTSTNAPTGTFFNTVESYFASFNTNLDSTFGTERADVFTGVDSIQGGSVNLANSIGLSYNIMKFASTANTNLTSTELSLESVTRNSGVAGTLVSEQMGVGLSFIVHDVKLTGYLDGGYDFAETSSQIGKKMYGEIGLRAFKALTTHTFAGVGIGAQFPRSAQVFSALVGFNF